MDEGYYIVTEIQAPDGYILDSTPHEVYLRPGKNTEISIENEKKPGLTIKKMDSVTGNPLKGAKFELWVAKDNTEDGTYQKLDQNFYYTDENGEIYLDKLDTGWYKVVEVDPPTGYALRDPSEQTIYVDNDKAVELIFENTPLSALVVWKFDSVTGEALEGAVFQVRYLGGTSGSGGTVIGTYKTSANGSFTVTGLEAGTYIVEELASPNGHVIDTAPQTVFVSGKEQDVVQLYFGNSPKGSLLIKKIDSETHEPLSDVEFMVTTADGTVVGDANGKFVTDSAGTILVEGIDPGTTLVVKETRTKTGYELDDTPQTATIEAGQTVTLEFRNAPQGCLLITKVDSVTRQPLSGVQFKIAGCNGCEYPAGTYTTDANGQIKLSNIPSGCYSITETKAAEGYLLNGTAQTVKVESGSCKEVTIANEPLGGLVIKKMDSVTKEPLSEVIFKVTTTDGAVVGTSNGEFRTDENGYVYIEDLEAGRYYLQELENEGYVPDTQKKTVYVKSGETTEVEWENTPITGQIQITKTSADYNSMNGWPAGTPIPNTVFEIYNYRTGKLMDTVRTDKNGVAVSKPLPLGRYKVVESQAAEFYGLDKTPIEVELEFAGQIVKMAMTNKSLYTNVSIKKTGYAEVMPGQSIQYDLSGIANNSTTSLTSFFWRDILPTQAVRLDKIITGTYNVPGNYKVVYQTNLSNGAWRTMYDNLSTMQNHTLDASPAALGLASNEYVTAFMVSFGVVPANFRQVEAPRIYCSVLPQLTGGTQFVNQADVGGVYGSQWIMATSRWVTRVYKPSEPLPRTGY